MFRRFSFLILLFTLSLYLIFAAQMGKFKYGDFSKPKKCGMCHRQIYQEWSESLMAKSFTHRWDDVEYFKLALPHALKFSKVAGVKGGCIACHSPVAFLVGDIPPKTPDKKTRANEGVSCEVCHSITGTTKKKPFNFSYTIKPGDVKQGPRKVSDAPHDVNYSPFIKTAEFCATCHDEASPYGAWVKSTYREWKNGPYAKEGTTCQDCHMYRGPGMVASGKFRKNMYHHVFHGAHFLNKIRGAVDVAMYVKREKAHAGRNLKIRVELFNGKVGHYIPSGSTEERMLWLEVWAIDSDGHKYFIPVKKKGFKGEEYTISNSKAIAYQAMGKILNIKGFKGLKRDGDLPEGARIFRKPFLDPGGKMTICQWYTAKNTLVDYRIGPRETKVEEYVWKIPENIKSGSVKIVASLYYSLVPSSVGRFLKLPRSEYAPRLVNRSEVKIKVLK